MIRKAIVSAGVLTCFVCGYDVHREPHVCATETCPRCNKIIEPDLEPAKLMDGAVRVHVHCAKRGTVLWPSGRR